MPGASATLCRMAPCAGVGPAHPGHGVAFDSGVHAAADIIHWLVRNDLNHHDHLYQYRRNANCHQYRQVPVQVSAHRSRHSSCTVAANQVVGCRYPSSPGRSGNHRLLGVQHTSVPPSSGSIRWPNVVRNRAFNCIHGDLNVVIPE